MMQKCKIFVSHSLKDKEFIEKLKIFQEKNIDFLFAEERYKPNTVNDKIAKDIDDSDYFILLLTKKSKLSQFVNQEIGYAKAKNKTIIIIKESESIKQNGFLYGMDYIKANDEFGVDKIMKILNVNPNINITKIAESNRDKQDYVIKNNAIVYQKNDDTDILLVGIGAVLFCLSLIILAKKG